MGAAAAGLLHAAELAGGERLESCDASRPARCDVHAQRVPQQFRELARGAAQRRVAGTVVTVLVASLDDIHASKRAAANEPRGSGVPPRGGFRRGGVPRRSRSRCLAVLIVGRINANSNTPCVCWLLAHQADGAHRQRRDPGARPARRRTTRSAGRAGTKPLRVDRWCSKTTPATKLFSAKQQ